MSLVLVAAIVFLAGTGLEVVDMATESGLEEAGVHVVGSESDFGGVRLGGPAHLLAILHCLFAMYHRVAQNTYFLT